MCKVMKLVLNDSYTNYRLYVINNRFCRIHKSQDHLLSATGQAGNAPCIISYFMKGISTINSAAVFLTVSSFPYIVYWLRRLVSPMPFFVPTYCLS